MKKYIFQRLIAFYLDSIVCIIIAYPFFLILFNKESTEIIMPEINYLGYYQAYAMLFYFPLAEGIFKTTVGKRVFKLHVIFENDKYHPIIYSTIRTLIKLVPFEPLSFLFNEKQLFWHETFSKTKTIKKAGNNGYT